MYLLLLSRFQTAKKQQEKKNRKMSTKSINILQRQVEMLIIVTQYVLSINQFFGNVTISLSYILKDIATHCVCIIICLCIISLVNNNKINEEERRRMRSERIKRMKNPKMKNYLNNFQIFGNYVLLSPCLLTQKNYVL